MRLDVWTISGSGFHFGRHGLGQEESSIHWPSDSLFAALVARQAVLHGAAGAEAWVSHFLEDPPACAFTSAFPRAGGVLFFPAPLRAASQAREEDSLAGKLQKRLKYVSEAVFRALLAGGSMADLYDPRRALQDGQALVAAEDLPLLPKTGKQVRREIWKVEQRPRVALGRTRQSSNLYHTGRTSFGEGCGLWFGVQWLDEGLKPGLAPLLAELGDSGLGGDRSSGFGFAAFDLSGSIELPDATGKHWVTLSRFLPDPRDLPALQDPSAAYAVENVGGWVSSPGKKAERRRTVRMLAEGSVLGPLARAVPGRLADVQPDYGGRRPLGHPAWRCGFAVAAGIDLGKPEGS